MIYRDITGQTLNAGDKVLFSLGLGVAAAAIVQKTDAVLAPNVPPMIHLSVKIPLPAAPNGVIGGVVKLSEKPESSLVEG